MSLTAKIDHAALGAFVQHEHGAIAADLLRRAVKVDRQAKHLCPVDTGRLRSSITHEVGVDEHGLKARIGSNVEYAIHVEMGTRFSRAQPFLRPALKAAA